MASARACLLLRLLNVGTVGAMMAAARRIVIHLWLTCAFDRACQGLAKVKTRLTLVEKHYARLKNDDDAAIERQSCVTQPHG
ncbi:hypothetical protein [Xanthomonas campestris]|uniref:hypothetical protein n=1 Tax=Xanthomonas campestris TaxID=339 RepID=UPI000E0F2565|nr:hypothetical protein [Xanthomonas campestris]MCC8687641.1 hypothetical protein [Xanthomonas campestris]MCW2000970.1 hypothetical protein [Xanthomonas campestris]MEA9680409.1 hypothetical protein [Xanthomonas campestris pv. raphani]MEA9700405.1 hypothetical protein [Xanthomonas campestris pv. raphani]MEA9727954.1 hypothetical protein [Xanthomonas campestris pv. raphani]